MDNPIEMVQHDLARLLQCEWGGTEDSQDCGRVVPYVPKPWENLPEGQMINIAPVGLTLNRVPGTNTIETVEIVLFAGGRPRQNFAKQRKDLAWAQKIVGYLFPDWTGRPGWIRQGVHQVGKKTRTDMRAGELRVGKFQVMVQSLITQRIEDVYALIVITRKPTLDDWESNKDTGD
ncbi:MAG: hypothetical protein HQL37_16220 [Alphaproteobacteria bacterium]|nr:hypothetical protein [Alphaproteobacteria bacterium]